MQAPVVPASPVAGAFPGIQWDPLDKLRLTRSEKTLLQSAEANPMDYTLASQKESTAYARVLLKVLGESSGPSGPSSKVSHLRESLSDADAMQLLFVDAMGVVTHYAVTRLYDVITCLRDRKPGGPVSVAGTFYNVEGDGSLRDEWRPLLRVLHLGGAGDAFAQRGAALCLAFILMASCPSQRLGGSDPKNVSYASAEEPFMALVSWIASQLQSSASSSLALVSPTLFAIMNCPEARQMFATMGGIGYLARHLRIKGDISNKRWQREANAAAASASSAAAFASSPSFASSSAASAASSGPTVQQLYELAFCLWTMTYQVDDSAAVRAAFARDGAVRALVDLVACAPREKVVRVSLAALRNLAICGSAVAAATKETSKSIDGSYFLSEMIGCGLMKHVSFMKERQWADVDIVDDLQELHKLLAVNYCEMSRWDLYKAEVESGHLEWGILHTEVFFKENARKMEGPKGDFFLVKILITLTRSHDEEVASIACFDLGEFVRFYPQGRNIAKRLGAKDIVLKLIEHENEELRHYALQCVSKMMVQNWVNVG